MKPTLSNVAWVPYTKDRHRIAEEDFERRLYAEKNCARCEYLSERHCDICDTCPAFLGHHRMWKKLTDKEGKRWIGFPTGNRKLLKLTLDGQRLKDRRIRTPFKHRLRFTGTLREGQHAAVDAMAAKGYGILEAPPRAGKTVMTIALSITLGMKTLILADQHEFLAQFLETIVGNPANGIKAMTNANKFGGDGKVVGLAKTYEEFEAYDICLATYQTFLSPKGQKLLKSIAKMFGMVAVDEAHKVAAHCFSKVVNAFPAWCRIGLTGTTERKDGKNVLTEYILGPITHTMEVQTMVPRVVMMETGVKFPKPYKSWTYFENALVEHVQRNRLIIKTAVEDLKAGRNIVIPVTRVHHAIALSKAINRMYGESIASHFIGQQSKAQRKDVIEKARNNLLRCVVGIRKLVQLGINVPAWDTIYECMPISNAPNLHQETSRIRTVADGKPQPLIRHFIEDTPQSRGCLRTCYWGTYKPQNFVIHSRDLQILHAYMSKGHVTTKEAKPIRF